MKRLLLFFIILILLLIIHESTHIVVGNYFGCEYSGVSLTLDALYVHTSCPITDMNKYYIMTQTQALTDVFGYMFMFFIMLWLGFKLNEL